MALTDDNGVGNMVMPVAPMYGGGGSNNGFGDFGGGGWWILLLFILLGGWGNGFGGFGNGGNIASDAAAMYPWMNNSNQINNGFRDQMLNTSIAGIQNSLTSGFGDVQTALCGGFAGINAGIVGAQNALTQQMYTNQLSDLERSFASQTAMTAGMTGLQSQLANCCCENRAATADTKFTIATESCATRTANAENTTALLNALNSGVQSIKDQICADKIEAKNDVIAQLRSELMYARGQASQDVQTAAVQAGQRLLANEIEQYVAPRPIPAYYVQNPNCCSPNCGCGG